MAVERQHARWQDVSCSEELIWRNEHAGADAIPFIECPRHIAVVVQVSGPLDYQALSGSVEMFVRRHAVLRSTFDERDGHRTLRPTRDYVVQVDCSCDGGDLGSRQTQALIADQVNASFDLGHGPLFRVWVARTGDDQHLVLFTAHHLIFDGWSRHIFAQELTAGYQAARQGRLAAADLPADYDAYVADEKRSLQSDTCAEAIERWRRDLDGARDVRIQASSGLSGECPARRHTVRMTKATLMRELSKECNATLGMTVLAGFALLVHRLTDHARATFGVPLADRPRSRFEGLAGLFMNAVPVRSDVSSDPSFRDLVRAISQRFSEAHSRRSVPYGHLVKALGCSDGRGWVPFRFVFNFVNMSPAVIRFDGATTEPVPIIADAPSAADLSLHVQDQGDALQCVFLSRADRLSADGLREIGETFLNTMLNARRRPDDPVSALTARAFPLGAVSEAREL